MLYLWISCQETIYNSQNSHTVADIYQVQSISFPFSFRKTWAHGLLCTMLFVQLLSCDLLFSGLFCHPRACSPPGSSVHGIFQARILKWVTIFFSRGSSLPMDQTQVSRITGRFFTIWATGKPKMVWYLIKCHQFSCNAHRHKQLLFNIWLILF